MIARVAWRLLAAPEPPGVVVRWAGVVAAVLLAVSTGLHFSGTHAVAIAILLVLAAITVIIVVSVHIVDTMVAVPIVGLSLGVASLACVMSVTTAFRVQLVSRMARVHGHVLITKYGLDFYEYEAMADELCARPEVVAASPFAWGSAAVLALERAGSDLVDAGADDSAAARVPEIETAERPILVALIKGVLPERVAKVPGYAAMFDGAGPDALDEAHAERLGSAVLGRRLARKLRVAVGDRIRLVAPAPIVSDEISRPGPDHLSASPGAPSSIELTVAGTLETGVSELDDRLVVTHLHDAQTLLLGRPRVNGVELTLVDGGQAKAFAALLDDEFLGGRRRLYRVTSWEDYDEGMLLVIRQVRGFLVVVLMSIVVVAGTSLVASLLIILRRRRHELATLMALGARRWQIAAIFVVIGLVACGFGLIAGGLLTALLLAALDAYAFPLDADLYVLDRIPIALSSSDALVPIVVSLVVCVLASGPPAYWAASVRPLQMLRS